MGSWICLVLVLFTVALFWQVARSDRPAGVPVAVLLSGAAVLVWAKFGVGDSIVSWLLHLPAAVLLLTGAVAMIIQLFRKKAAFPVGALSLTIVLLAILLPGATEAGKFVSQESNFNVVAAAAFDGLDTGRISVGDEFDISSNGTYDLERLERAFAPATLRKMKELHKRAGIYRVILADGDVIYFSRGAVFQSISGIAIVRNGKDPAADAELHARYFDGVIRYEPIGDGAYEFFDGL
ncbi:hypothetical protein ACFFIY_04600 [Bhargavaea ullalensis]|uniref:Uncharacterized protein n=1 Tax=Bhargavaea ullalensis TaxID=1265685 RepID=A0ABV2GAF9_9BACL